MSIGFQEILLISIIALVVLGPERLPTAIKTVAIWVNRCKRSFNEVKSTIEKEINAEEIRREIHNENVLHELGETKQALDELDQQLNTTVTADEQQSKNLTDTVKD